MFDRPGEAFRFIYNTHDIRVVLTREFVKRFRERKPSPDSTTFLLTEGIKDPLDALIAMPGLRSMTAIMKATKSRVNVVLHVERRPGQPPRILVIASTVHVGRFIARDLKDAVYEFDQNPSVQAIFESEYEPELVRLVLDDLSGRARQLEDGVAYHFGDDTFTYVAEVEGSRIYIPDARWEQDTYVYEFSI
jgi:hypothetical protein